MKKAFAFFPILLLSSTAPAQVYQPLDLGHVMEQAEKIRLMQAQEALLQAQAQAERQRIEAEQKAQATRQERAEATDTAADVRFLKFIDQTAACQKINETIAAQSGCIERLKLADPDYARTWIEANTPGLESPELHAHRANLLRRYLQPLNSVAEKSDTP